MATFCFVISPEQYLESEALDPEPLRCPQVMTRPGNTQMTRRNRLHGPIIAEPAGVVPGVAPVAGEPAGSGLLDQDGAGIEQIEALALHVLL